MVAKRKRLVWEVTDSRRRPYVPDSFMRPYKLYEVDLNDSYFDDVSGIYIIWSMQRNRRKIVYVGQSENGLIRDKLLAHRSDLRIELYASEDLYVAWARAREGLFNIDDFDGIERYLHERLKPLVCYHIPEVKPIQVNLPWDMPWDRL